MIRAGETYAVDRDLTEQAALDYWFSPGHRVFVAVVDTQIVGTYYLRRNHGGGGAHVCNCGYMTSAAAAGQGIGRAMGLHSLEEARSAGYRAMQFNCVVSSNERAVRLWQALGFEIAGRLPGGFAHPRLGFVDAFVMYRAL